MSESFGITAGVAGRYASALFKLAEENGKIDAFRADLNKLQEAIMASADLNAALANPSLSRADMTAVMGGLASALSLSPEVSNFVKLMASKRRLGFLSRSIQAFDALAAEKNGEVTVEATAAAPLSDEAVTTLTEAVAKATGKTINIKVAIDPELIGGIILKVGSRMIDASLRSKLALLKQRMREVG